MKSVLEFHEAKLAKRPISMVTCYDYTSARIASQSSVDCFLVGDSLAMTMHGHRDTLAATPDLMALHVKAVRAGAPDAFIIGDFPFLAHRGSLDQTMRTVATLMQAGANAVKIEGVDGSEETIRHVVESGVPVMGHLGLTPQSVHQFGGFKVQGRSEKAAKHIHAQAQKLQQLGVFSLVLECVPTGLATVITKELEIPTIGIGAGAGCDGQVLVFQDLLGLNKEFRPRFVRAYANGAEVFTEALNRFDREVKERAFPSAQESYKD